MELNELPALEQKILALLHEFFRKGKTNPSMREMARILGVGSTNTVHNHVKNLEQKGLITREKGKARSIRLVLEEVKRILSIDFARIPLLGTIAAGTPIPVPDPGTSSYEADGEALVLPLALLPRIAFTKLYALRVKGDSMIDACILDRDVIVMQKIDDPQVEIKNGDLVAAWIRDEQTATLKRFYFINGEVELRPENPRYKARSFEPENIEIRGKVIYVSRQVDGP